MKKLVFIFLVLSFLIFNISAQNERENKFDAPIIDYCEAVKNPTNYAGKTVKIFAEYRAAFEYSGLSSESCAGEFGQIWVEWKNYESCGDAETAKLLVNRSKGNEYNYLEGVFVGKFFVKEGSSGFGHMNAKPFKIEVSCVENATLLPKENSGCKRVDKTSPFHYLEYVKIEPGVAPNYEEKPKKEKKERIVWFRLVNNSTCSIFVPTSGNEPKEIQNEDKIPVIYKLDPTIKTRNSILVPRNGKVKLITKINPTPSILLAGNSIYFGVPLRYFQESYQVRGDSRESWNISIPFKYADRQTEENYDPLYFAWRDLPKELLKK